MKRNEYKKDVFFNYTLILQFGIHMLVPIILCVALGVYIDGKYDMYTTLPLLILGILAGGRNTYVLAKSANRKSYNEKNCIDEQKYIDDIVNNWENVDVDSGEKHETK